MFLYTSFASFETNETFNIIKGKVQDPGDLYFAFYIDGVINNRMPQKGEGYVLDTEKTNCTNGASIDFNTDDWSIKVLNMTKTRTKCTLYFKKGTYCEQNPDTGACTILAKGETDKLKFDNTTDNNLRYIGANPNNYVSFNNELWRIIGVFNNIDDGTGNKETRLKIIRNEPYSEGIAWDTDNVNDWSTASLQEELNGTYLENITSPSKEMIKDAVWKLGGSSTRDDVTTSMFYERERGTDVYSGRPIEWTGKIGLMYPSDYGYATSGGSTTNREICLNTELYNWYISSVSDCKDNDWLYDSSNNQWTLTPRSSNSDYVFFVNSTGNVNNYSASSTWYAASPALYLTSNVKISGGEGTESNPYVLSL